MESVFSYKSLMVWQKSMDLVVSTYQYLEAFPREELYGISSQMKKSAISIPSNIAEGRRRLSSKEYKQFLSIAYGSGAELETQIEISKRLGYGKEEQRIIAEDLLCEVMKMLNKMLSLQLKHVR